jgi:uncharacterized protein (DUF58 family)
LLPEEILRKIHLIEITTRKTVTDMMTGGYKSQFKGHGMQFSEHRVYVDGDDIRHIDWKVSARTRDPMLKKYEEERELTVFLVIDVSASKLFGSSHKLKAEMAAEISGMLAWAAISTGDKVGVLLFSGKVDKVIPPKKGKQHILKIIRDVLVSKPGSRGTDLKGALEAAERIMKHSGVVFVVSDFLAKGYETVLKRLSRRHDVISVVIGDEREREIPALGQVLVFDPETGEERVIDTGSYSFQKWFKSFVMEHDPRGASNAGGAVPSGMVSGGKVEFLQVLTKEDYANAVVRFFQKRSRRRR